MQNNMFISCSSLPCLSLHGVPSPPLTVYMSLQGVGANSRHLSCNEIYITL